MLQVQTLKSLMLSTNYNWSTHEAFVKKIIVKWYCLLSAPSFLTVPSITLLHKHNKNYLPLNVQKSKSSKSESEFES